MWLLISSCSFCCPRRDRNRSRLRKHSAPAHVIMDTKAIDHLMYGPSLAGLYRSWTQSAPYSLSQAFDANNRIVGWGSTASPTPTTPSRGEFKKAASATTSSTSSSQLALMSAGDPALLPGRPFLLFG